MMNIATWAQHIVVLDQSGRSDLLDSYDPMLAFAMDELLCKQASQHNISICRIWRHPNAFVLGQQDARLPYAQQAMEWLRSSNYMPIVRNSGGAAVPLDEGVVNISLIFPSQHSGQAQFQHDFEKMFQLIAMALESTGAVVHKGEIAGAYCPGEYDLSISGRKFCGIAQRRLLRSYCVQAFVIASGSGKQRTSLVRRFYEIASGGNSQIKYPLVVDDSTASLAELTTLDTHHSFIEAIKDTIDGYRKSRPELDTSTTTSSLILPDSEEIIAMAQKLTSRYSIN
jgi:octanoyl-[GcvH]:protein N-octanoyltransferase